MDRIAFDVVVTEILAPSLKPGHVVMWDTRSVHKSINAQRLIAARGCHLLCLPPYCPDLAPIEQALSTLKTAVRQAKARTCEALNAAITAAAAVWFAHCGYPIRA